MSAVSGDRAFLIKIDDEKLAGDIGRDVNDTVGTNKEFFQEKR